MREKGVHVLINIFHKSFDQLESEMLNGQSEH